MKKLGTFLPFNTLSLLEKAWDQPGERIRFNRATTLWPEISLAVIHSAFMTLEESGCLRRRKVNYPGRVPYHYWHLTERGRRVLAELMPFRELWGAVQPREVRALAIREGLYLKLQARKAQLFGKVTTDPRRANYLRRGPQFPRHE